MLLGFCSYNAYRSKEDLETIINILFEEYKDNLFRPLNYVSGNLILYLDK